MATTVPARAASESGKTVFSPEEGRRTRIPGLPADVLAQSARRLRLLALLYAFVFFMAAFFPMLLVPEQRARFNAFHQWGPGAISIAVALLVAAATRIPTIPLARVMQIGLVFEVASSFGIAAAEFLDSNLDFGDHWVGLSWVAVWVMLFTIVVPSPPRRAILATLASVSAVPIVAGFVVATRPIPGALPGPFFLGLVFPYLLVALMAFVGSQVIHALGREVTRARELGGYRLVERLGVGGMGEVWRAEHRLLVRPAAIKLVRAEVLGAPGTAQHHQAQERFEREAQATASLRSPHTVELYDFGLAGDGTFYHVMELLDGFDLQTLVERFGPLPSERAIHLLVQICDSLGEAHEQGLVHRDIKPANVYTCRYGRELDFVKVLDFGMVKSQRASATDTAPLTGEQLILGTPAFMAPEVILGKGPIDGRVDLYAVGCLAHWLLTGRTVFEGKNVMEVLVQHAHTTPLPPSARTDREIPAALDEIVLACLAKDPDARPGSADRLAQALLSTPMPCPWTTSRAREWWDRNHPAHRA